MRRWPIAILAVAAVCLIAPARPASAQSAAPYNWTGFHASGNVGWMWSKADTTVAAPGNMVAVGSLTFLFPPLAFTGGDAR